MTEDDDARLREITTAQPPFAQLLGLRITFFAPDRVEGEMMIREEFGNRNGVAHGGALMAFADNLGGTAASLNLREGQTTTTLESKTNFLRAVPVGDMARGVCVPLHRGRTTMVWQTTITRADDKVAVIVTQTQMVLDSKPSRA